MPNNYEYKVGTLVNSGIGHGVILQDLSGNVEYDTNEVPDENGNNRIIQHYNHRAVLTGTAVCPLGSAVPVSGSSISISGVTLPTFNADGSCADPTITISKDGTSGTTLDFLVTAASVATSNKDVAKYNITLTRYLENSIGAITTEISA